MMLLVFKTRRDYATVPTACKNLNEVRGIITAKRTVNKGLSLSNPKLIVQHGFQPPAALHCAPVCTIAYLDYR